MRRSDYEMTTVTTADAISGSSTTWPASAWPATDRRPARRGRIRGPARRHAAAARPPARRRGVLRARGRALAAPSRAASLSSARARPPSAAEGHPARLSCRVGDRALARDRHPGRLRRLRPRGRRAGARGGRCRPRGESTIRRGSRKPPPASGSSCWGLPGRCRNVSPLPWAGAAAGDRAGPGPGCGLPLRGRAGGREPRCRRLGEQPPGRDGRGRLRG